MSGGAVSEAKPGPLAGIKVLDLTTVVLGPLATQILGDLGAEVIKIESLEGDIMRYAGPARHREMGHVFLNLNRNKRSLVLDLKQPEATPVLLALAAQSDVLMHNMRPQAMARLGFTWERLSQINPRLVYCSAHGYGQDGPLADRPAFDDIIQGASGLVALEMATGGEARFVPTLIGDKTVGLTMVYAVMAALLQRARTGLGQAVEVPMLETMTAFVMAEHMGGLTFDPPTDRRAIPGCSLPTGGHTARRTGISASSPTPIVTGRISSISLGERSLPGIRASPTRKPAAATSPSSTR
jgi:crotonobetainyl-CoA:carnitine CoA-transferase CaiB-like acyl-CoA transferase